MKVGEGPGKVPPRQARGRAPARKGNAQQKEGGRRNGPGYRQAQGVRANPVVQPKARHMPVYTTARLYVTGGEVSGRQRCPPIEYSPRGGATNTPTRHHAFNHHCSSLSRLRHAFSSRLPASSVRCRGCRATSPSSSACLFFLRFAATVRVTTPSFHTEMALIKPPPRRNRVGGNFPAARVRAVGMPGRSSSTSSSHMPRPSTAPPRYQHRRNILGHIVEESGNGQRGEGRSRRRACEVLREWYAPWIPHR